MAKKSEKNFAQKVCFLQGLSSKMRYLDLTWIVAAPRNESIFSTNLYARNNFYFTRSQSLTVHHKPYYSIHLFIIFSCQLDTILRRQICIARLSSPVNFGPELGDVQFVLLVLGSNYEVTKLVS